MEHFVHKLIEFTLLRELMIIEKYMPLPDKKKNQNKKCCLESSV